MAEISPFGLAADLSEKISAQTSTFAGIHSLGAKPADLNRSQQQSPCARRSVKLPVVLAGTSFAQFPMGSWILRVEIRQAAHKIEREGYRIEELSNTQMNQNALKGLCSSWMATKSIHREARFLVRPLHFGVEPGVRKFYLFDSKKQLCAFVAFDPICLAGQVLGYSPSVKCRAENSPVGAEEAITKYAIERFQQEGRKFLRLGLMPLYQVEKPEFRDAWPLRMTLQWLYRHGSRWVYNFHGLADFKHRYRGELTKTYLATDRRWGNAYRLIALMRVCKFFS